MVCILNRLFKEVLNPPFKPLYYNITKTRILDNFTKLHQTALFVYVFQIRLHIIKLN